MAAKKGPRTASNLGTLAGVLFLVFLVLKLTGVIDWSWWWVTSPLWLSALAAVAGLVVAGGVGYLVYRLVKRLRRAKST